MNIKNSFVLDTSRLVSRFEKAIKKFAVKKKIYRLLFRGKGLEFEAYRKFGPDEDYSAIDWKASMRSNDLLARQYKEERELDIYFLVDVSSSMVFGSKDKLKAEYAAEIVALMSHMSLNSGDRVGMVMYSDKPMKFLPAKNAKNQFFLIKKFLENSSFYGGVFNFKGCLDYSLRFAQKGRSLVFVVISDFIHLRKDFQRSLRVLVGQGETIAFLVRDPLDNEIPKKDVGLILEDPNSARQILIDAKLVSEQYKLGVGRQLKFLRETFKRSGLDLLELNTHEDVVPELVSFLRSRLNKHIL